jgi:hypothetical protein
MTNRIRVRMFKDFIDVVVIPIKQECNDIKIGGITFLQLLIKFKIFFKTLKYAASLSHYVQLSSSLCTFH